MFILYGNFSFFLAVNTQDHWSRTKPRVITRRF